MIRLVLNLARWWWVGAAAISPFRLESDRARRFRGLRHHVARVSTKNGRDMDGLRNFLAKRLQYNWFSQFLMVCRAKMKQGPNLPYS